MAALTITDFTDPACPFAWSAEPSRRRLEWLFGDQIHWKSRMVGLASTPEDYLEKGFTPARQSASFRGLAQRHHMPIDTSERPRMAATVPACRAMVAARLNEPDREHALLRRLRMRHFSGQLLDDPETIALAAEDVGIVPEELAQWMDAVNTEPALEADLHAARHPSPEALALTARLARWSDGWRYTCPSYEIVRDSDGARMSVPGFQPLQAYEIAIANLAPQLDRREDPSDVKAALEWAQEPLASAEVAAVCTIDLDSAREQLGRVAHEDHVGSDGFWSLGTPRRPILRPQASLAAAV